MKERFVLAWIVCHDIAIPHQEHLKNDLVVGFVLEGRLNTQSYNMSECESNRCFPIFVIFLARIQSVELELARAGV
jgi:hypothetical protein